MCPNLEKYKKMIKNGVPFVAVKQKVIMENGDNSDQIISQLEIISDSKREYVIENFKNKVFMLEDVEKLLIEQIGRVITPELINDLIKSLVSD